MAIYVYATSTGALYSYCPNDTDPVAPAATLAANGLTAVSGLAPQDATHAWNPATKTVITVAAPATPNVVTTSDWIMQFTTAEHAAIAASTDANVQQFLFALQCAQTVNLNNPMIQNGLNYLVSIGLLAQARATTLQTWVEV